MHLLGRVNSVSVRGYGGILWLYTHLVNSVSVPGLWWHIMIMHLADCVNYVSVPGLWWHLLGCVNYVSAPGLWWHIMTMHLLLAALILFQCPGYGGIL